MSPLRTARVRREERRATLGASLREALDAHGLSQREAAALIGVDESLLRRWADAHDPLSISVADLAALPPDVRVAIVQRELLPGHVVVRSPDPATLECDLRQAATLVRSASDAAAKAIDAWADGHMTRAEALEVCAAVDVAMAHLVAMRERALLAMREGVIGRARAPHLRAVER